MPSDVKEKYQRFGLAVSLLTSIVVVVVVVLSHKHLYMLTGFC